MSDCTQVMLREFIKDDIDYKIKWVNDPQNNRYLHYDLPLKKDKTLAWYRRIIRDNRREDYTILHKNCPVGLVGLLNIDDNNKKAELYVMIGEHNVKGKGIATCAIQKILKIAFKKQLRKLYLFTEVENVPAQSLFEKIGFIKEGLLRNDLFHDNRYIDRYIYGIDLREYFDLQ